jgi:hypothetical protein
VIDSSAPVEQPVADQAAPVEAPPPEQPAETPVAEPTLEALEADLEANAIDIPDGDKLVPLSAVSRLREKLKHEKQGSAEAATLRQQLDQANQALQAVQPLAEAFRALQQAGPMAQPVQQPPQAQPVEDTRELEEIARDFDFYKSDGTPDLDKSRRHQARTIATAEKIAQQTTAPLVQDRVTQAATYNYQRALNTTHPVTGQKVDPDVLAALVGQIQRQPNGLETLANPESMKHLWLNAFALSSFRQPAQAQAQPAAVVTPPVAPPVMTERAGGRISDPRDLSTMEKKAAKEAGLTEKEYHELAKGMKW